MEAKNEVIAGDYSEYKPMGGTIIKNFGGTKKCKWPGLQIVLGFFKGSAYMNRETIENWEIDEQGATPKGRYYRIWFNFKDGKRTLVEIDNDLYDYFLRVFHMKFDD